MLSPTQVRAALDALFDAPDTSPPPPALPEPESILPHNLDGVIEGDLDFASETSAFRWYAGQDRTGIHRIFRFQRGLPLEAWHQTLRTQALVSVRGPFRSQVQATKG